MKKFLPHSMLLFTIILMDLLAGMEFDLFVPSFPELQKEFGLSPFWVEASLSVNFIGYCGSLFFVGALSDRYGRKPIILVGLLTFILGSLLCLQAPSYLFLLGGRFLQGIGIAAPGILSFLIIAGTYPLKQQQSLFSILNGIMNLSVGGAPVLGSYIALYFHWQGNFVMLLFLGVIAFGMTVLFIPTSQVLAQKEPLIRGYTSLFRVKPLMLMIIHFIFNFIPYWIFVGMSPLLYMEGLGVSLAHFGYYQGVLAFIFGVGSLLFGFIVNKYNHKKMLYVSLAIFIVGLISMPLVSFFNSPNPLLITLAFLPFIIGQIIPSAILFPLCLNFIPQAKGRVEALMQAGRLIFSALSLEIAGYFYQGSFQSIGVIISFFILMTIMTLCYVINNRQIIKKGMN